MQFPTGFSTKLGFPMIAITTSGFIQVTSDKYFVHAGDVNNGGIYGIPKVVVV